MNPQDRMQQFCDDAVARGVERGIQLVAYVNGRKVVDVCSGVTDATGATQKPVTPDTLFPVFSVSKGIMSTVVHRFVERGQIAYDTPLARHWPEFAAHGKQATTLGQALSHMAGLPLMPVCHQPADAGDWDLMCSRLAAMAPLWPAGTRQVYHPVTHGWLIGEPLRRIDGRPVAQMIREEVSQPLGLENDIFFGVPDSEFHRIAILDELFESGKRPSSVDDGQPHEIAPALLPLHEFMNRPEARKACIPASSGIMTARGIARFYAALSDDGIDGLRLLPADRVNVATQRQLPSDEDARATAPKMSLGYFLEGPEGDTTHFPIFTHPGYGGSTGFLDRAYNLAVGFTKNYFSPTSAGPNILRELRAVLDMPVRA